MAEVNTPETVSESMSSQDSITARNPPGIAEILSTKHVGIAGCGGLGSNAAIMLTRAGIGHLTLVDYDHVEWTNLNRQHYFRHDVGQDKVTALTRQLLSINENLHVTPHKIHLNSDNIGQTFSRCDVVIEAFDSIAEKTMLIQAFMEPPLHGKSLVCGSGLAGTFSGNDIRSEQISRHIFVCGDMKTASDPDQGLLSTRVTLTAAHQAHTVIQLLCGLPWTA